MTTLSNTQYPQLPPILPTPKLMDPSEVHRIAPVENTDVENVLPEKVSDPRPALTKQQHHRNVVGNQKKTLENKKWYVGLAAQSVIALICGAFIVLLCYVVNPPITQKKSCDEFTSEKQDWRKVLGLTFIVILLVLLIPEIIRLVQVFIYKKKSN